MANEAKDITKERRIVFVTGGARSGKSKYAQEKAMSLTDSPVYVATAKKIPGDLEFEERIIRHRSDRNEKWTSIEEPLYVSKLPLNGKVVVIDCITLWLTNFFSLHKYNVEATLAAIKTELIELKKADAYLIIISNEIGLGLHAETEVGRKFTDLQGWANQFAASIADEVVFMVSGIPMLIKGKP